MLRLVKIIFIHSRFTNRLVYVFDVVYSIQCSDLMYIKYSWWKQKWDKNILEVCKRYQTDKYINDSIENYAGLCNNLVALWYLSLNSLNTVHIYIYLFTYIRIWYETPHHTPRDWLLWLIQVTNFDKNSSIIRMTTLGMTMFWWILCPQWLHMSSVSNHRQFEYLFYTLFRRP